MARCAPQATEDSPSTALIFGRVKKVEGISHSVVSDSVIPWTVARQAPLSTGFSRQEDWSGLPFPPPGDLPEPTRLLCPWSFPGKNSGAGCHFLLQIFLSPPGFSVHGDSPGKNSGTGCHFLLQGIFPTQESNPRLLNLLALAGGIFTFSVTWGGLPPSK